MFYPQEVIDQVLDANDIVEVIGQYVNLTKKGSTYFGLCPFHNEKTPSFSVTDNGSKKLFYCFGCHTGGSALTFLMKYENCSYQEALKTLADRAGIKLPEPDYSKETSERYRHKQRVYDALKDAAIYFHRLLKSERGAAAYDYLRKRGLPDETITAFGLGYSDKYRDDLYKYLKAKGYNDEELRDSQLVSIKETGVSDVFWNRVMFPIMDVGGRVIAFGGRVMGEGEPKYLNSRESICFEKSKTLYGLNEARKSREQSLILAEGYMDVISLHRAGFKNAVASLGTALTDSHAAILKRFARRVIISYDSDGPGQDAALRAVPKLKEAGLDVRVASLEPYKDPDELIGAQGASEYKKRLAGAADGFLFEIKVLARSFDLKDPAERTRFGNETASRMSYITDELERENYLRAICGDYDLDYAIMNSKIKKLALSRDEEKTRRTRAFQEERKERGEKAQSEESQKLLLSLISDTPSFYADIKNLVNADDFSAEFYGAVARLLFEQMERGRLNTAGIISAFEEDAEQEKAARVLRGEFEDVSDEEKKKALTDCVIRLKTDHIERLIKGERDLSNIVRLKKEQEEIGKLEIF